MNIFMSVEVLLNEAHKSGLPIWELVMRSYSQEAGVSIDETWKNMAYRLKAMREADASYDPGQRSHSGLTGGDAEKMRAYVSTGNSIAGGFIGEMISAALRMGECNACMHRIVAAPTAGACGVLPAVLLPYSKKYTVSDDELIHALFVTCGFGGVIATRASMSGAECGCQAEIGTASAMAAAALVYLHGGNNEQMSTAVAIALKNLMGLVCDPVAGLVEVPCVKRNAIGAMNALSAAEMALAGITSRIPTDEVIDAMGAVGRSLPAELRETGRGGIAASPTAERFRDEFFRH